MHTSRCCSASDTERGTWPPNTCEAAVWGCGWIGPGGGEAFLSDAASPVCCCCRYASHMLVPPAMARAAAKAALEAGTDPDEITSSIGSFKCVATC